MILKQLITVTSILQVIASLSWLTRSAQCNPLFVEPNLCNKINSTRNRQQAKVDLFNCVNILDYVHKKRILITGGAGFVGSHLVDDLMIEGHDVTVLDNFYTGRKDNIEHWMGHENFNLLERDVINGDREGKYDQIYHLAAPASPVHYMADPIKTIKTITLGTMRILNLAKILNVRVVLASTSEVYGSPLEHPQPETYWGNVNPIGPRACYDESKRLSESLAIAYRDQHNVSIGIARIFNTYGSRMLADDGRVISNFISQAIHNKPLTVYGDGKQTRSFQYISDLVLGLKKLMNSTINSPVNLGNPDEITIQSLAETIKSMASNTTSEIIFKELPTDDPVRRRPDVRKAATLLDWRPTVKLDVGLGATLLYFNSSKT